MRVLSMYCVRGQSMSVPVSNEQYMNEGVRMDEKKDREQMGLGGVRMISAHLVL